MDRITLTHKFAVYVDYTTEDIPRPFYVGKGTEWRCNDRRSRNSHYRNIREKYGMQRQILFETSDETEAFAKEHELIAEFKTYERGGEGWWGANGDMGGRGGPSTFKSLEHREHIRQALLGKPKTQEHCQAMSRGGTGKVLSEEHRRKIGEASRQHLQDPHVRELRRKQLALANLTRWNRQPSVPVDSEGTASGSVSASSDAIGSTSLVNK